MKRGYDIIGLPVICLEESCKKIEIKDILYDKMELRATCLLIQEGGYFREQKVIALQNIKNIGSDAVVIQNKSVIEESPYQDHIQSYQSLIGMEVITYGGQDVGIVQDILFDVNSGRLSGLILSEGLFHDLVEGRSILPLKDNLKLDTNTIIISNSEEKSILSNTGGLKRLFSLE
ncbi:uncharacterized protein YrrD [Anaerosolibacter carboniphilus]|uniref:Uncharacterized protein YrrD n=1 Tax=Anaerosolibacter carboniphilus TaxID=1417629 RepID=A0A841KV49_9FIRM|nr:PRC-barrel domain-containing protein [Anaerosolibacter carboniphilus]MBB6214802.1 uncharacterized protein YrrD [Anaerosolibacter carboniphilus]